MGNGSSPPVRILIADHHRITREGFQAVLKQARSAQRFLIAEAESAEDALQMLRKEKFDVLFIVYDIPAQGGIKAIELILRRNPHLRILGLMTSAEPGPVVRMVTAGAMGCILTDIEPDTLVAAIRTVLKNRQYFSNDIALALHGPQVTRDNVPRLTKREQQVLDEMLRGYRNHEIAEHLFISKRTVDKHRQNLNAKLGARSAVELGLVAVRLGLLKPVQA